MWIDEVKKWVAKNRPIDLSRVTVICDSLTGGKSDAIALLMTIAFEAGRTYQAENPNSPLDVPPA